MAKHAIPKRGQETFTLQSLQIGSYHAHCNPPIDDNNYGHERPLWNSPVPFLFIASIIYIFISIAFCRVFLVSWTHWGPVTHICVNNLTTIGSVNGLLPGRRQAITWTNAGVLLIVPLETNFSEILIEISTFSFKKMRLKVSSAK